MATEKKSASKSKKGTKAEQEPLQEPVLDQVHAGTTPEPEKPAERTDSQKTCFVQDRDITKDELKELEKAFEESAEKNGICIKLPEEVIRERYGISPDQTNIPKLLYALLCEAVSK